MVVTKKFILSKHFKGEPKSSDVKLIEEELPPIKDGGQYIIHIYICLKIAKYF